MLRFARAVSLALAVCSLAAAAAPTRGRQETADARAEVYNLRAYTHPNFTRIVIDIGVLREYVSFESREAGQIAVDIYQARLNPIVTEGLVPTGGDYIGAVRVVQKTPTTVRVTAAVNFSRVKSYQVFHVLDPFRIVIDIFPAEGTEAAPPPVKTPQPAAPAKAGYSMARQLGLGVRTIVIDPGHGGLDPGCLDAAGHLEKVGALDISLRLKALLAARKDINVILTRETDILVPLETRTVLANQKRADLFISIHINANPDKNRRGVQTFYLNFNPDPSVIALAARENATTTNTIGDMDKIIKKIIVSSKVIESRELAEKIQSNLVQYLSRQYTEINDLGTRGGPFWTLIGAAMPSVLVEVSHFSNAKEAARLMDSAYRERIAEGIYQGILDYIQSLGKG